jgi:predicted DNA-binding transcriptional regulator AlpA
MDIEPTPTATASGGSGRLLDEHRTARYLGLRVKTLRNWRSAGKGPSYIKIGRIVRYRVTELDEFIEKRLVDTGA